MNTVEGNLRWVIQWLFLLNRSGFPTAERALAALERKDLPLDQHRAAIHAAAVEVFDSTHHLAHPSLDALAQSLETERV